ncbi:MAG: hypothetical protein NC350_03445 [Corallococcus sp.]|nr:hypothetical protein [Corallococcus sp.]
MLMAMFEASNAWESFVQLFTEMTPVVAALFILGIIFCVIEIFVPGFGVFGILGTVMIVAAIVIRMLTGGDAWMLLYMVLISLVVFILCFVVMSTAVRKGKLGKTALFDVGTAVPVGKTDGTKDYSDLVGKVAVTCNFLRPVGQAKFKDGSVVDVVAHAGFIEEGTKVKVVSVEGQKVTVEQTR